MRYFLLSVWKKDGQHSYSTCCSTSKHFLDLINNMRLYKIQDDEMFVISQCENGTEKKQKGNVVWNRFYDRRYFKYCPSVRINDTIMFLLNSILQS